MDQLESEPIGGGNELAVACARADSSFSLVRRNNDVFARAALFIRARALFEKAMAAPATPFRQFLIGVARSRLAKRMATTSSVTLMPPPSP